MKPCLMFDLDNTALGGGYEPYMRLPEHFCRLLDELTDRGWTWATNTAWAVDDQWRMLRDSPVCSRPLVMAGEYGRRIAFVRDDGYEFWQEYENRWIDTLQDVCMRKIQPLIAQIITRCPVERMMFYGHQEDIYIARSEDAALFRQFVEPWLEDEELEISLYDMRVCIRPSAINKGNAVRALHEAGHVDANRLICAGDSFQDLAMMKACKHPICPANAKECVTAYVKEHGVVSGLTYSDGVRDAVEQLMKRI